MDVSRERDGWRDREVVAEVGVIEEFSQSRGENREEIGTSGSKRKPDTHIREKASKLTEGQTKHLHI